MKEVLFIKEWSTNLFDVVQKIQENIIKVKRRKDGKIFHRDEHISFKDSVGFVNTSIWAFCYNNKEVMLSNGIMLTIDQIEKVETVSKFSAYSEKKVDPKFYSTFKIEKTFHGNTTNKGLVG